MNWKSSISLLTTVLLLVACDFGDSKKTSEAEAPKQGYQNTSHIIEAEELTQQINDPTLKVIDFRKKESYDQGHLPGALNIWRPDIEDTSYDYGGMMAPASQIEVLFSNLGIKTEDTLVVYDDRGGCDAARLWWILSTYGFDNIKILNGGIDAWKSIKGTITLEVPVVKASQFRLPLKSAMELLATKDEISTLLQQGNYTLLDTRTTDEYTGKRQKKGAKEGGRIPSSIHLDWTASVDYENSKKFKPYDTLVALYAPLQFSEEELIIPYCHSGVRSAHTTFVLKELLGHKNVKNYDGSWTEWSHFETLPKEKDSITTLFQ